MRCHINVSAGNLYFRIKCVNVGHIDSEETGKNVAWFMTTLNGIGFVARHNKRSGLKGAGQIFNIPRNGEASCARHAIGEIIRNGKGEWNRSASKSKRNNWRWCACRGSGLGPTSLNARMQNVIVRFSFGNGRKSIVHGTRPRIESATIDKSVKAKVKSIIKVSSSSWKLIDGWSIPWPYRMFALIASPTCWPIGANNRSVRQFFQRN